MQILSNHKGAVEAIEPLMNMVTFTARNREKIVAIHTRIADGLDQKDAAGVEEALIDLAEHTLELAQEVAAKRKAASSKTAKDLPYLEMKYL